MTRATVHTRHIEAKMEDFNDFDSCVGDLEWLSTKAWDTYHDTCSKIWVDVPTEDENGNPYTERAPHRKDDGWPRMKEFAEKVEQQIKQLKALLSEYQDLKPPEPEYDEDPASW